MASSKKNNKVNKKKPAKDPAAALARDIKHLVNKEEKEQNEAEKEVLRQRIADLESQQSQLQAENYDMEIDESTKSDSGDEKGDANDEKADAGGEEGDAGGEKGDAGEKSDSGGEPSAGSAESHKTDETRSSPPGDQSPPKGKKVKIETVEGEGLFVSDDEDDDVEDDNVDKDGLRPLGSMSDSKPIKGAETVGWGKRGNATFYINRYGKRNSCIYRLDPYASSDAYDDKDQDSRVTLEKNRFGDLKTDDGQWKYRAHHINNVFGVAWDVSENPQDPLSLLDPRATEDRRFPATYILVQWKIDGELIKAWETRTCLRNRLRNKRADRDIYNWAIEAENRYAGVQTGRIAASSRSPSRPLGEARTKELRNRPSPFQTASPEPEPRRGTTVGPDSDEELEKAFQRYLWISRKKEEELNKHDRMDFAIYYQSVMARG